MTIAERLGNRSPVRTVPARSGRDGSFERGLLAAALVAGLVSIGATLSVVGEADPGWLPPGVRTAIAVLVACVLPGAPVVALLRPASRALGVALTAGISLAVTLLAAEGTVLAGWWHPLYLQLIISTVGLALVLVASRSLPKGTGASGRTTLDLAAIGRWLRFRGIALGALALAAVFLVLETRTLDVGQAGEFGLFAELGWAYVVALALVAGAFAWGLTRPRVDHATLVLATTMLLVLTTSLVTLTEGVGSVNVSWVHRGFIDMITHLGALPPPLDARISWAGFFAAGAHVTTVAGLPDAAGLLGAAPVFFNVLMIAPLFVIGRAISASARTAWVGIAIYVLANWYQQDYFAPQAVALFLFATILATALWWLRAAPGPAVSGTLRERLVASVRRTAGRPAGVGATGALATEGVLVLLLAAMVVSHQFTPVIAIGALLVLALTGSTRFRLLWLSAALMFSAWLSFGAQEFWAGHLDQIFGDIGQVGANLRGGIAERVVSGIPLRVLGQGLRLGSSGLVLLLAAAGWWAIRRRRGAPTVALLALLSFGLVFLQSYGGEVVIRVFVMASLVLAPLAALAVMQGAGALGRRWPQTLSARGRRAPRHVPALTVGLVGALILGGGLLVTATRGLNISFEHVTRAEVLLADTLSERVPTGTRIVVWGDAPYFVSERERTEITVGIELGSDPEACIADLGRCTIDQEPEYVFLTPTQEARPVLMEGYAPGWLEEAKASVLASGRYVVEVDGPDVTLLRRSDVAPVLGGAA